MVAHPVSLVIEIVSLKCTIAPMTPSQAWGFLTCKLNSVIDSSIV